VKLNIFKAITEKILSIPYGMWRNTSYSNYAVDYDLFVQEAYNNPFIYKAFNEIVTDCKTIKTGVFRNDGKKWVYVENHVVNKWLKNPNPELNGKDFLEYYLMYMYFGGGLLLYKTKGILDKHIYIYSPDSFDIQRDDNLTISGIKIGNSYFSTNELKDLKVCKAPNIEDKIAGKSQEFRPIVKSLALVGDMSNFALKHQNTQLKNSGKRNGIMTYKNIRSTSALEEAKKQFRGQTHGESTGDTAWLNGDNYDFKSTDMTPQELDWLEGLKYTEEVISQAMGVPVQLISSRGTTYNNLAEMKKKVYIDTAIPLVQDYCEDLTVFFQDDLQENEKIWYDVSEIEELKENVLDIAEKLSNALRGKVSLNEFRQVLSEKTNINLKALPSELGDKVLVTSSDMFLDDLNVELEPLPKENEEESTKE